MIGNKFSGNQAGVGVASANNIFFDNHPTGNVEAGGDLVRVTTSLVLENEVAGKKGQGTAQSATRGGCPCSLPSPCAPGRGADLGVKVPYWRDQGLG